MIHLRLRTAIIVLFISFTSHAQMARLYTSESGLANSHTHDIFQDSKGFIWISTENGLSRFDGIKFTTFNYDRNNPNSLASNVTRTVFEDSKGRYWIGTSAGLQRFDTDYNSFTKINLEDWSVPESDQHIMSITEMIYEGSSRIVVGTSGHGIYVIDSETLNIEHEIQNSINKLHPSEFISMLFKDSKDRLWISSDSGGLTVIDISTGEPLKDIWGPRTRRVARDTFSSFIEDESTGNIIIGTTNSGVVIFDEAEGKIRRTKRTPAEYYHIMAMIPNKIAPNYGSHTYLVGIENEGLKIFDAETEEIRDISFPNVSFDTSKWKVHDLMEDNQGNVWVGAIQSGVMVIPKSMFGFEQVELGDKMCITSVIEDHDRECLWIGTDGNGVYKVDRKGNVSKFSMENSALSNNSIMSLALDERGCLWVATYLGGLYSYTESTGFRPFKDSHALRSEKIYCLAYSPDQDLLYIGTHGNGFFMADPKDEKTLKSWNDDENKWISSLYLDSSGLLWVGTYNGPMAYDSKVDKLINYNLDAEKSIRVNAFYESRDGNIWIGTGEGLVCMERSNKSRTLYTEEDGLACNSVTDILEDDNGNLWISTLNGLSQLNLKTNKFKNFYQHDGLQENEFNSRAAYKAHDGKLYFGGIKGLTSFYPNKVDIKSQKVPPLYLSNLNVMNSDVMYDPQLGTENILDKQITEATQITLPNTAKMFSLDFSVLEYTNPRKIVYEYMMEGLDKTWNKTLPGSNTATYTNIPHGRYRLKIKAFYEGEPDNHSYREVGIRILAPWYLSVWAWIAYIAVGILAVLALLEYQRRRRDLKIKREESELKEMKLQMFTNISHEIRTPLTLVMSPLKKMRESEQDPQQKNLYNLMYRNSLRILRLVNQLLDMRKVDNGQMKLHFLETDVVYFIKDIMQSFENLAVSRHIHFHIESDKEINNLWIDQGNFDKIIFNVFSNAFKHTPDNGEIAIRVSSPEANTGELDASIKEYVEFLIENSGSSIEDKHLDRIFDRFYQADIKDARMGSGVGLHLTKLLVELHHGKISAYNTETGVAFRILIPAGCSHLNAEEMTKPENHKDLYTKMPLITEDHNSSNEDITYTSGREESNLKHGKARKKIILVDDDSEMRAYLKLELQEIYNVEICANGKEAWGRISTGIPDAVITDLVMDKMDGAELCEKIKKNPGTNHIPVILLTSSTDEKSQQRCIDSGADRFFTKPISLNILKSALANAIATRETMRNKFSRDIDYGYGEIKMVNSDNQLAVKVIKVIRENIENSDFSVEELSHEVGMSRVHLNRKLKETMNISPSNLIKSIRLKQAAYLLINNKVNISEVAYKVGFSTHSYFSNSFHDYFGMTPKEFVAQYANCTDEETLQKLFG